MSTPGEVEESGPPLDQPEPGWVAAYPATIHPELFETGERREIFWTVKEPRPSNDLNNIDAAYKPYLGVRPDFYYFKIGTPEFDGYLAPKNWIPKNAKNVGLKSAYLAVTAFDTIVAGKFPWNGKGTLPIRTADGSALEAFGSVPEDNFTKVRAGKWNWNEWLDDAFPEQNANQRSFARSINPTLDLKLRLMHDTFFSAEKFAEAVSEIIPPKGKGCNQKAEIDTTPTTQAISNYKRLSLSPYGDYEVWISNDDFKDYLKSRPDRPIPSAEDLENAANPGKANINSESNYNFLSKLPLKRQGSYLEAESAANAQKNKTLAQPNAKASGPGLLNETITFQNMADKKPRSAAAGQKTVMNESATTIAQLFGWPDAKLKIPAAGRWPGGNSPSEWLHKIGYAYGLPNTQQSGNLMFGTSETNSLMTRFETAFQQYLKYENSFRSKELGQGNANSTNLRSSVSGQLVITELVADIITRIAATGEDSKVPSNELNLQFKPYWLWYGLRYKFTPNGTHLLLNAPVGAPETQFYNFQRPFLTYLENYLDQSLRTKLYANQALAIKNKDSQMQGIEPTRAFVSTPIARRLAEGTDVFNTNALTSVLLSIGSDAPATASNTTAIGFVSSTAPQNLPHSQVWSQALEGGNVNVLGTELHQPSLVSVDTDGRLVSVAPAQLTSSTDGDVQVNEISSADAPRNISSRPIGSAVSPFITTNGLPGVRQVSRLAVQAPPAQTTPPGFVLTGDIQLFGSIAAKLYTFQGTAAGAGIKEMVTVPTDLSLGKLFANLVGDAFDTVGLQNVQLNYFDTLTSDGKPPGLYFEADVAFKGALQPVGDILKVIFNQQQPMMAMEAMFGRQRDWTAVHLPAGFSITGTFDGISASLANFITFTSVGVKITVDQRYATVPSYRVYHELGYGFFGTAHVMLPGSAAPLNMDFVFDKTDTLYSLSFILQDDEWKDVFGIAGLTMTEVKLSAQFDETHISNTIVFDIQGTLQKGDEYIQLDGFFMKGNWALSAEIDDFDLGSISQMFGGTLGGTLPAFNHDIDFDSIILSLDPTGISLTGQVTVDEYTAAEATIDINRDGVSISGSVSGDIKMDALTIKQASLEIFIAPSIPSKTQTPIHFGINGVVDFGGLEISSTLYLSNTPGEALQWTVYGEYDAAITSASLAPNLKGTFLDLPMRQIALIAGNTNSAVPGFTNKYNYPIIKGIQLCAEITSIDALNKITRVNLDGLILRIGLVEGAGLDFGIVLPMDKAISFGPNITSTPISVSLDIAKPPSLQISAGLNITVPKQTQPLVFTMTLAANIIDASATAQLTGYWVNPFGISPNVKIGPNMALELGITYATFFTTGTPSKLAISGGLAIGKTEAQVALSIGNDPTQELISASLAQLTLGDMVSFASDIVGKPIPLPNESMLYFEQVAITLSTGVSIGTTVYPPGASFVGNMELLGKKASISASIHDGIQIAGSFEGFSIGPLAIKGATTPNAQVQLEISPSKQHFLMDGGTQLLEVAAGIHVEAELLPLPNFSFILTLAFTELLPFTVNGKMLGAIDLKDTKALDGLDFQLDALLEQKILNYLISQANMQLVTAQKAAKDGFDQTKKSLDQAEASFNQSVTKAQVDLTRTQAAWTAKSASAQKAVDQVNQSTQDGEKKLQANIQQATIAYTAKVNAAEHTLDQQKATSAAAIQAAQAGVTKATADSAAKIDAQKKALAGAQQDMNSKFGNAIQSVKNAQASVQSAQNDFNAASQAVTTAQSDLDHGSFLQRAALAAKLAAAQTAKASKQAALTTAQEALSAAQAVLNGAGYQAAQATLNTYQASLQAAENAAPAAIATANATAQATINAQNSAINTAQAALDQTKTSSAEALAAKSANASLDAFMKTQSQLLANANAGLTALLSSAEYAAFHTAQTALAFANSNTKDLDVARHALDVAQASENAALQATQWMVSHAGNFLNLTSVELSGTLKGLCDNGQPMKAHVVGMVADKKVDVTLDYNIGKTPELIKSLFEHMWGILTGGTTTLPVR